MMLSLRSRKGIPTSKACGCGKDNQSDDRYTYDEMILQSPMLYTYGTGIAST